jgi:hypothetical protein
MGFSRYYLQTTFDVVLEFSKNIWGLGTEME